MKTHRVEYEDLLRRILALDLRLRSVTITGGGSAITQLTGDVAAGPGPGSVAATIANDVVTNAKLANMAQATLKGRAAAAGTGDPTDLTPNEASTVLDGATDPFLRTSAAGGSGITQLTGDVTAGPGSGSQSATIANDAVTYAKIQNISAASRLLGRGSAGGAGNTEEISLGANLSLSGTTLNAVGGGGGGVISADGYYLDDGSQKFAPVFPVTPPIDGDFAWVNQGGASIDTTNGSVFLLSAADGSTSWRIRKKAVPGSSYVLTVGFIPHLLNVFAHRCGVLWRESGSGKFITFEITYVSARAELYINKWASPSAFSSTVTSLTAPLTQWGPLVWIQLEDDGANRKVRLGYDGLHWFEIYSVGNTDFITADEIGFGVDPNNATYACGINVISWVET